MGGGAFSSRLGTVYENLLYVLPGDGSCRKPTAIRTISLPNQFSPADQLAPPPSRCPHLPPGTSARTPISRVGLSDGGVRIYNVTTPSSPQLTSTFGGMATGDRSQTPVTALAWTGEFSFFRDRRDQLGQRRLRRQGQCQQPSGKLGDLVPAGDFDGRPVGGVRAGPEREPGGGVRAERRHVAVDRSDRYRHDGHAGAVEPLNGIMPINPIPRFDGSGVGSDFAVSSQATPAPNMVGYGALLRWDGTSAPLTALPVSAGSPNTVTSVGTPSGGYPGIKQGRLQVQNTSGAVR